jgi:serine/threonine protein kinase/Tfp pilus assembly protein PilF
MELLLLLIEHPGVLVTREQIIERIWGKDVFLDTESGINAAIRKIRQVFKDDPERPRFVQTVTGKGYRFIASIEEPSMPSAESSPVRDRGAAAEDVSGKKVSHYRVLQFLGGGGMGVVYKAEDLKLGRQVALKFLPAELASDPMAFGRFEREARAASALDHPNICSVYELGEHEGQPFIAMQLLEGKTLREWIETANPNEPLRTNEILDLAIQITHGLEAAHRKGIIHRDIKPANIFITSRGQAKILDFGVATFLDANEEINIERTDGTCRTQDLVDLVNSHSTRSGASMGTPSYLSPEQIRRERLDARTDLFSFGLVLYEMVTGQRAFSGDSVTEISEAVLERPPRPVPELNTQIPAALSAVIEKATEKNREYRYQSAAELRADLDALHKSPSSIIERPSRTRIWIAVAVAFMTVGLAVMNLGSLKEHVLHAGRSADPATEIKARRSIAVLAFKNLSGKDDEGWISTALSEMLSAELAAGQTVRVVPSEDVARMKLDLSLSAADSYGRDTLNKISSHLGTDIVVLGSYLAVGQKSGGKVRLNLQLQDARSGETVAAVTQDGTEADLADLVSRGSTILRERLGIGSVPASAASEVRAVMPSNPEAARLYAEGLAKLQTFDALGARDLLQKGIKVDPKHALSHAALAEAWSALGYDSTAEKESEVALGLSTDLPREQRLLVEGRQREYARDLRGAIEIYRTLRNFFPDNLDYGFRLAAAQTKARAGKDALETVARMRKLPKPDSDDARIDLVEALAAQFLGDFASVQRSAAVAVRKAKDRGSRSLLTRAMIAEAWSWERRGDLDKAMQETLAARDLAEGSRDQRLLGLALRQLGAIEYDKGEYEKARASQQSAMTVFQKIGDERQVARTLETLGNTDYDQERMKDARRYYEGALRVDTEIGAAPGLIGSDLGNIANVLDSSGDLEGATRMQQRSLQAFREAGDKRGECDVLLNLGNVLFERGDLESAKGNYDQGLVIAKEIGFKHANAYFLHTVVDVHLAEDHIEEARASAEQAIRLREELQEQANAARSQIQLARVALEEGNAAESEHWARQATVFFDHTKAPGDLAWCAAVLAQALLKQSKLEEAQRVAESALSYARQTTDRSSNFAASLAATQVDIVRGKNIEASRALELVLAEAARYGYLEFEYEARFQLGKQEMQSGNRASGTRRLQQLQQDARSKHFLLIARKSEATLNGLARSQ